MFQIDSNFGSKLFSSAPKNSFSSVFIINNFQSPRTTYFKWFSNKIDGFDILQVFFYFHLYQIHYSVVWWYCCLLFRQYCLNAVILFVNIFVLHFWWFHLANIFLSFLGFVFSFFFILLYHSSSILFHTMDCFSHLSNLV